MQSALKKICFLFIVATFFLQLSSDLNSTEDNYYSKLFRFTFRNPIGQYDFYAQIADSKGTQYYFQVFYEKDSNRIIKVHEKNNRGFILKVYSYRLDGNISFIANYNNCGRLINYSYFMYDKDNRISKEINQDNKKKKISTSFYSYNEAGYIIEEKLIMEKTKERIDYYFTYDAAGYLTEFEVATKSLFNIGRINIKYDELHRITDKTLFTKNDYIISHLSYDYKNDKSFNPFQVNCWLEETEKPTLIFYFAYDKYDRLKTAIYHNENIRIEPRNLVYEYYYNDFGELAYYKKSSKKAIISETAINYNINGSIESVTTSNNSDNYKIDIDRFNLFMDICDKKHLKNPTVYFQSFFYYLSNSLQLNTY